VTTNYKPSRPFLCLFSNFLRLQLSGGLGPAHHVETGTSWWKEHHCVWYRAFQCGAANPSHIRQSLLAIAPHSRTCHIACDHELIYFSSRLELSDPYLCLLHSAFRCLPDSDGNSFARAILAEPLPVHRTKSAQYISAV
jgi:hypothetical protein